MHTNTFIWKEDIATFFTYKVSYGSAPENLYHSWLLIIASIKSILLLYASLELCISYCNCLKIHWAGDSFIPSIGHMAVFIEFGKDAEVSRKRILYNPLYDPKKSSDDGAELKLTREEIAGLKRYIHIILLLSFNQPITPPIVAKCAREISCPLHPIVAKCARTSLSLFIVITMPFRTWS